MYLHIKNLLQERILFSSESIFDPYDSSLKRAICQFAHLLHLEPAFSLPLFSNLLRVCSAGFAGYMGLPFSKSDVTGKYN